MQRVDWLASTGLAVDRRERRVARLLRSGGDHGAGGELLLFDERGVVSYRRVDELFDAHDALWTGDELVVASTSRNSLLWLSPSGDVRRVWKAPGEGDAWHLNCLLLHDDRLLASAYGRFDWHRGWAHPGLTEGKGFVFDVETGEILLGALSCPHHPRVLDDHWLVCDSAAHAIRIFDMGGGEVARVSFDLWTRGLTWDDDYLYVGLSVHRLETPGRLAAIAVIDRRDLREVERVELPCREIYDLTFVPAHLISGMETGFRTNAMRAGDEDQYELFRAAGIAPERLWASSDPLPAAACRTRLVAHLPSSFRTGEPAEVAWRLQNDGGAVLASAEPFPVNVASRWFAEGGGLLSEGERSPLPRSLPPGEAAEGSLWVLPPAMPGTYVLRIAPVQERVQWFDDIEGENGFACLVEVAR